MVFDKIFAIFASVFMFRNVMKKVLLVFVAMAVCSTASAQFNLGKLVKKAKQAVTETVKETVEETVNGAVNTAIVGSNPFRDVWRIDSICAIGTKTSNNFGKVWLVINAEAIVPLKYGYVDLGGTLNKTYSVIGGKTYKPGADQGEKYEMPEGVPMVLDTKENKGVVIENVPASTTEIQAYNMYIYIDPSRHQTVLWKNIPIMWIE